MIAAPQFFLNSAMLYNPDENSHYLLAGSLFVHEERHFVTTVLGSCVSVCLWDCVRNRGGINHYMLPFWNGEGLASPDKRNLRAKVFGGGIVLNVTNPFMNIGERNIQLAEDMLHSENIPIISADTGGKFGRKLIFNTETGSVFLKKLTKQIDDIRL